jgi:hypothetical protein
VLPVPPQPQRSSRQLIRRVPVSIYRTTPRGRSISVRSRSVVRQERVSPFLLLLGLSRPMGISGRILAFHSPQRRAWVSVIPIKTINMAIKKSGSFHGKSNALGHGGRAAQMRAQGVPGGVIGMIARREGAAPGGPNYHGVHARRGTQTHNHPSYNKAR